MTIHHDKLAYGKLAPTSEEMSEQQIAQMLKELDEENKEEDTASLKNNSDNKE